MSSLISQSISLKGSTDLVTEFFKYAVNTILYQRGVYPPDDFHMVKKYGQTVLITQDLALENYLEKIFNQIGTLLVTGVTQLVVAIVSKDSKMSLERWVFDINHVQRSSQGTVGRAQASEPEAMIQAEIRFILRQIVSTMTFLPIIDEPTVFDIFVNTQESADVPANECVNTNPEAIEASKTQQVKLRSFSTDVHKIEAMVSWYVKGNPLSEQLINASNRIDQERRGHPVSPECPAITQPSSPYHPGSSIKIDGLFEGSFNKNQVYRWNGKEYTKGGRCTCIFYTITWTAC
jgi:mitotic spindle assembly checkpoint protein MAD2